MIKVNEEQAWRDECRRRLAWDVIKRIKYGFRPANRPVLDEMPSRAFATMAEYREWCERELPGHLGLTRPKRSEELTA